MGARREGVWQSARRVAGQSAAGDVGNAVQIGPTARAAEPSGRTALA
jgi:hypothetical protein